LNQRTVAFAALAALSAASGLLLEGCGESNKVGNTTLEPSARAQVQRREAGPKEPLGVEKNGIRLVYPHDGSSIASPSTFLVGAIPPGSTLTANGQPVRVNPQGFFAHVVPLSIGANSFNLMRDGAATSTFAFTIKRPAPPKPVPSSPPQFRKSSIEPKQDIGAQPGDMIVFAAKASPDSVVQVKLGARTVQLQAGGASKVKAGLDTTFGVQFQNGPNAGKDFYSGFYRVNAADNWQNLHPEFVLTKRGVVVKEKAAGRISVLPQPFMATTTEANTIVRVGPGAGRTTPLDAGVRMLVDGFVGDSYRVEMAPGKHLWIEKSALQREAPGGTPPTANVRTINIENEGANGARVVIPLNQRLPYEIKQEVGTYNKLILKVYGATADTDWITEPSTSSNAVEQAPHGTTMPNRSDRARNPVSYVNWQQAADRVYQVAVNLNTRQQWGFWAEYEDTNLVLHVKGAPNVALAENSLRGLRICVDPGHGGRETGAIGCSGIKEATINLAIGKKLERILRDQGAEVIMTRNDDVDVSLADRVAMAVAAKADLLVSVHNNSLPDGRNPWTEHGTSSYYYHPQSRALANAGREGMVAETGLRDYNTRWQNLALCRPSQMPAALMEVAFVINPDEYAMLLSNEGQERAALGIAKGVRNFLSQSLGASTPSAP
jgi:N-acetylmuramoyl-L-alanine amidase